MLEDYLINQLEFIDETYGDYLHANPTKCCAIDSKVPINKENRALLEMQILSCINPREYTIRIVEGEENFVLQIHKEK